MVKIGSLTLVSLFALIRSEFLKVSIIFEHVEKYQIVSLLSFQMFPSKTITNPYSDTNNLLVFIISTSLRNHLYCDLITYRDLTQACKEIPSLQRYEFRPQLK